MIFQLGASCLIGFATLTGADPQTLMAMTYRDLLTTLGGNRLTPEAVQKMIETKDPFEIPPENEKGGGNESKSADRGKGLDGGPELLSG